MGTFTTLIVAAVLVEAIINIIKNVKEKDTSWKYWASLAFGIVVSVLITFNWSIDIFRMFGMPEGRIPYLGALLTGLILSRGSNVVNDLIGLINLPRNTKL